MAKLTAARRKKIPTSEFAGPDRSYPIDTANRARNALSRVSQFGSSEEKAKVRGAVHRKYPVIGKGKKKKNGNGGEKRAERQFQAGYEA